MAAQGGGMISTNDTGGILLRLHWPQTATRPELNFHFHLFELGVRPGETESQTLYLIQRLIHFRGVPVLMAPNLLPPRPPRTAAIIVFRKPDNGKGGPYGPVAA